MKPDDIKKRLDEIIQLSEKTLATKRTGEFSNYVNEELYYELLSSSLSFLKNTFGEPHPFFKELNRSIKYSDPKSTRVIRGILNAAKQEIEGGWIFNVKSLVSAEIFSDFLEMAQYLLKEKYHDAAAVMVGSVLEEHLRFLCNKNSIPLFIEKENREVPKKADSLNIELASAEVYNKLDQKSITSWLDLRNKAAHGKYVEYTIQQVQLMCDGVTNFIARTN